MQRRTGFRAATFIVALVAATLAGAAGANGAPDRGDARSDAASASDYWTAERRDAAIPRDLVLDHRGLAYLQLPNGDLRPYGHDTPPEQAPLRAVPSQKPTNPGGGGGGGGRGGGDSTDSTPPVIDDMNPASGATIGSTHTFSATVTDDSGVVKSVAFEIWKGTQSPQSFNASANGDVWSVNLQGFTDGEWSWRVIAKDGAKKGGNTRMSGAVSFEVSTGTGGGGGGGGGTSGTDVANAEWANGGAVQTAAGRIYFRMPANPAQTRWTGYVCSGTVVTDSTSNRSVILTAAHCVYDDEYKAFASGVLFIPNQAGGGSKTDLDCDNDPLGCWSPSFGVVDDDWASRTFPDNIPWDYAYYVVDDGTGNTAHSGAGDPGALDELAGSLGVEFTAPSTGAFTHALGYSYSDDPNFMYCAEDLATESSYGDWWLGSCDLSGGSSGGPWVQPMDEETGSGPIISVNSWGYTNSPGMAGPRLSGTSASCLFTAAKGTPFPNTRGITAAC